MPAPTASLLSAYSCAVIDLMAFGIAVAPTTAPLLVRGKLSQRLRDLVWVGHEELLLRGVERHCGDVRTRDPYDRPVEVVESVLRDDRRDLRSKASSEVVL